MTQLINLMKKGFPFRFNFFNSYFNNFYVKFYRNCHHSGSKVISSSLDYQRNANYWRNNPHVPDSEYYSHGD